MIAIKHQGMPRFGLLLCIFCYAAMMVALVGWLVSMRRWALVELASANARGDWQAWRDDVVRQQSEPSPVQRRVPKSVEPPGLVLMRDYFGVSLTGAVVFTTVLYWVVMWFVAGIVATRKAAE